MLTDNSTVEIIVEFEFNIEGLDNTMLRAVESIAYQFFGRRAGAFQ